MSYGYVLAIQLGFCIFCVSLIFLELWLCRLLWSGTDDASCRYVSSSRINHITDFTCVRVHGCARLCVHTHILMILDSRVSWSVSMVVSVTEGVF